MQRVSGPVEVAGRLCMPCMPGEAGVDDKTIAVGVRNMWIPSVVDSRNDLSGYTNTVNSLVSCHLVGHQPKERGPRAGNSTNLGFWELPYGLDLATQA